MKQSVNNEFKDGLNLDLHPLVTPKTVLTDNLNGTFITYNGNEFCLQNDRGNKYTASLTTGFTPIGIKEHNGILYIVSVNGNTTEIGTYPKVDWNQTKGQLDYNNYGPLYNYNEHIVYCIWSHYDGEELEREGISIDFQLLNSILDEYDCTVSPSLFGDPGPNQDRIEFNKESDMDNCYARLNALWPNVFGKGAVDRDYDDETFVLAPMRFNSKYTTKTPLTIEIQDSYDGSVNLILVADGQQTRIINTAFSAVGNKYKLIDRNQTSVTNYYRADRFDKETELIRTSNILTNIDLLGVQSGGQFKGGNYTFYIKFGDADYNQTDIVAESGIVSIFNGNDCVPSTISGTLLDERTDKMVHLAITGLNHVYSKIYIYYSREYSDTQGYRMTEYGMFKEPIDMIKNEDEEIFDSGEKGQSIWLTGFEQTTPIDSDILNIDYHTIDWARAESQHSNMLFLGNVGQEETFELYQNLKELVRDQLTVSLDYSTILDGTQYDYSNLNETEKPEYYSVTNIYKYVGYWPNELYRFGIVFILKDGSKTPVFNPKGKDFRTHPRINDNDKGVFFTPEKSILNSNNTVNPIGFSFTWDPNTNFPDSVLGWFVVRQKRIPNTICQGLSIAIDKKSNLPVTYYNERWITESFLSSVRSIEGNITSKPYLLYDALNINSEDESSKSRWLKKMGFDKYWKYDADSEDIPGMIKVAIPQDVPLPTLSSTTWQQDFPIFFAKVVKASDRFDDLNYQIQTSNPFADYSEDPNISTEAWAKLSWELWLKQIEDYDAIPVFIYKAYNNLDEVISPELYLLSPFVVGKPVLYKEIIRSNEDWERRLETMRLLDELWNLYPQYVDDKGTQLSEENLFEYISSGALLSLDPIVKTQIAGMLDGSNFNIQDEYQVDVNVDKNVYTYEITNTVGNVENRNKECQAVFVPSDTNIKMLGDYGFSTIAGSASDASTFKYFSKPYHVTSDIHGNTVNIYDSEINANTNINLIRGRFTPFIGIASEQKPLLIQSVSLKNFNSDERRDVDANVRKQDNSEYFAVSNYFYTNKKQVVVYRGDCFTNTVSIRMIRNHIDPTVPANEIIVDEESWWKWVTSKEKNTTEEDRMVKYDQVNLSDINTVALGYWVTFKCLSSYNLGLRAIDSLHTDEMALLGSPRSFYPLNGASSATGNKTDESTLLNDGLSATVGRKRYNLMPDIPYSKSEFANRIMFSNVNVTDAYTNGYRTFQGVSYKDYDKQYGAITKLISLGQNIFVVMEHGLGLVPVNPKALMQTTTGEIIHIYGYGVLPDEMTIISQDYGSKYEHSVIRTPIGIYGIDVDAKKIWRYSEQQGFKTISDVKIETYLNDYLIPLEIQMGTRDIRTHYNGRKGDLMFTWNGENDSLYSICYNERLDTWVTRYDWKPIVSENINDEFYSLNFGSRFKSNEHPEYQYEQNQCSIWDHSKDVGYNDTYVSSWYDSDKMFEFEFVVSDPIGVNKVFDNIQIISNNVQPQEMEISVIGDDYEFKRDVVDFQNITVRKNGRPEVSESNPLNITTTSNIHGEEPKLEKIKMGVDNPKISTIYKYDQRLNQSMIVKWQPFKDIYKFGRRIGNIQYKGGSWFAQIEPILINSRKEARIRDKWAKIRIKYSGKDLAIITAIKTLINI